MKCRICNKEFPENIDGCIEKDFICIFCFPWEKSAKKIIMSIDPATVKDDEVTITLKGNIQG